MAQDQSVLSCLQTEPMTRAQAALALKLIEERTQERFEALQASLEQEPHPTEAEFNDLLQRIYDAANDDLRPFGSLRSDPLVRGFVGTESSRILSETALRLSIAGAQNSETTNRYRSLARQKCDEAYESWRRVPRLDRATNMPDITGRLAQQEAALVNWDLLREPNGSDPGIAIERIDRALLRYRHATLGDDTLELESATLQAMMAHAKIDLGAPGPYLEHSRESAKIFDATRDRLKKGIDSSLIRSPEAIRQSKVLDRVADFYQGTANHDEAIQDISRELQAPDQKNRELAQEVVDELLKRAPGTSLGRNLAWQIKDIPGEPSRVASLYLGDEGKREKAYDQATQDFFGKSKNGQEISVQLGLPSYRESVRSDGGVQIARDSFLDSLNNLANLQSRQASNPGSVDAKNVAQALREADLSWLTLQCNRIAVGAKKPEGELARAPFGTTTLDLGACDRVRDTRDSGAAFKAAHREAVRAIEAEDATAKRWATAEITFDLVSLLATGGISTAAKSVLKAAAKQSIKTLFKATANETLRRAGSLAVRTATAASTALVTDLGIEEMSATRNFLISGLRDGKWDTQLWRDSFAYTSSDGSALAHFTRVAVTAIASEGVSALWRRVPAVAAIRDGQKLSKTQKALKFLKENSTGSMGGIAGGYAEGLICKSPKPGAPKDNLEAWTKKFAIILTGALKSGRKQRFLKALATSVSGRAAGFGADGELKADAARALSCLPEN